MAVKLSRTIKVNKSAPPENYAPGEKSAYEGAPKAAPRQLRSSFMLKMGLMCGNWVFCRGKKGVNACECRFVSKCEKSIA